MNKVEILGDEFDSELKSRLIKILKELGAKPISSKWVFAGSQELGTLSVVYKGEGIIIESETFIGLSISGPEELGSKLNQPIDFVFMF